MTPSRSSDWHIITCEFPPQIGGVSDYTMTMAKGLAEAGSAVHVWCPRAAGSSPETPGVTVHREFGTFSSTDLRRVGTALDRLPGPRRLLVQWVPHGFGYRSLNLMFAVWLANRAWRRGDELHVMIHEPFLRFSRRPLQCAAALVHRAMLVIACSAATRIWISIPSWADDIAPYVRRRTPVRWLPIPAPDMAAATTDEVADVRRRIGTSTILGHFGTFSPLITPILENALDVVMDRSNASVLLVGRDSDAFRRRFLASRPEATTRVHATGVLEVGALCRHIQACDLMLQPYPDGVSSRRTSTLALMAHGVPLVTNLGSLSEPFWEKGRAVALVDQPDGTRLGQAAVDLLQDEPMRRTLTGAALEMYDRLFSVRHGVAALEASS